MEREQIVSSKLGSEVLYMFESLMEIFKNDSFGKCYQADVVRECIKFTWKNLDKVEEFPKEITRLNEIIIRQQNELNEKNNKIEKALHSLQ